jgi:hypothetical protein
MKKAAKARKTVKNDKHDKHDVTIHTSSLLRKHRLVLIQNGEGAKATFNLVDWMSHRPASAKRESAFLEEQERIIGV